MGTGAPDISAPTPSRGDSARSLGAARLVGLWVVVGVGIVWLIGGVLSSIGSTWWAGWVWWLLAATNVVAATVVVARRPDHPLVPWFAAIPCLYAASDALGAAMRASASSGADGAAALINMLAAQMAMVVPLAVARVVGLFATGIPRARWELAALRASWLLLLAPIAMVLSCPVVPTSWWEGSEATSNPFYLGVVTLDPAMAASIQENAGSVAVLVGAIVLAVRYRGANADSRRPMRWLLIPIAVSLPVIGATAIAAAIDRGVDVGALFLLMGLLVNMTYVTIITIGILWPQGEVSPRELRLRVAYRGLWGIITAAFVIAGSMVGVAAAAVLPIEAAVLIAVVVALAIQPLRRRLEHLADRWLFGVRPDPRELVVRLGESLADSEDLDALLPRIGCALEDGFDLEWARVRVAATVSAPGEVALAVPIEVDGEQVGVLECGRRRSGDLQPADIELIRTFARQGGIAVRNVMLTAQLAERAADLRDSRARLVRAQEAERRRIERNIHDGVQQDLAALIGVAACARFESDGASLDALQTGLQRVLADIRELSQGIHPSVLSDRGLLAAVEALASRHPVPIIVRADPDVRGMRLPDELEGAAYFTVAESLANSLKHASASSIEVTLSTRQGMLALRTSDDGVGFDPRTASGNGLANLAERVAAVGGRLQVSASTGGGATVVAEFALSGDAP